ncbi:MAG TPA: SRPBCC family protein [Baekduia sp.]|uniref:SRPBCC family protein n=1 Tax=Baekduia sp. TaxID=2600305 RepID=UPI002BEE0D87|nr:SRPBCC family protein [Baekduia sp.]HMJ37064.1 SRPBCC family protein [Baekduia sp.]
MTYALAEIDDRFFEQAPIVIPATVELAATPEQVWEALGSDEMWSWAPIIDQLEWTTPRPQSAGAIRRLRLLKAVTIEEEFYRWDAPHRATFRVTRQSRRAFHGLAEDFLVEASPTGSRLTWTMAVAPRGLAGAQVAGRLAPVLAKGNAAALGGIRKILLRG